MSIQTLKNLSIYDIIYTKLRFVEEIKIKLKNRNMYGIETPVLVRPLADQSLESVDRSFVSELLQVRLSAAIALSFVLFAASSVGALAAMASQEIFAHEVAAQAVVPHLGFQGPQVLGDATVIPASLSYNLSGFDAATNTWTIGVYYTGILSNTASLSLDSTPFGNVTQRFSTTTMAAGQTSILGLTDTTKVLLLGLKTPASPETAGFTVGSSQPTPTFLDPQAGDFGFENGVWTGIIRYNMSGISGKIEQTAIDNPQSPTVVSLTSATGDSTSTVTLSPIFYMILLFLMQLVNS
jgi:hypothetical protein